MATHLTLLIDGLDPCGSLLWLLWILVFWILGFGSLSDQINHLKNRLKYVKNRSVFGLKTTF